MQMVLFVGQEWIDQVLINCLIIIHLHPHQLVCALHNTSVLAVRRRVKVVQMAAINSINNNPSVSRVRQDNTVLVVYVNNVKEAITAKAELKFQLPQIIQEVSVK